jgi:hypothetical protein
MNAFKFFYNCLENGPSKLLLGIIIITLFRKKNTMNRLTITIDKSKDDLMIYSFTNKCTQLSLGFVSPFIFTHSNESINQMQQLITGLLFVV